MATLLRSRRVRGACCAALVVLVTACGGGPAAPRTPTTSAAHPAVSSTGSGPQQWIRQFCGQTQQNAEAYVAALKDAIVVTAPQTKVRDLESTKQVLHSTVSSGIDASMTAAADRLAATTTEDATDAAARTYLLGVYRRLHRALAAAQDRIKALPTTDVKRFVSASSEVAGSVVSAVQASKDAVTANGTLGPVFTANPNCG